MAHLIALQVYSNITIFSVRLMDFCPDLRFWASRLNKWSCRGS